MVSRWLFNITFWLAGLRPKWLGFAFFCAWYVPSTLVRALLWWKSPMWVAQYDCEWFDQEGKRIAAELAEARAEKQRLEAESESLDREIEKTLAEINRLQELSGTNATERYQG